MKEIKFYPYRITVGFFVSYLIVFLYPLILTLANSAPEVKDFKKISVKILMAQSRHPNLVVEMNDGTKKELDFPVDLSIIFRGLPEFIMRNEELRKLNGCNAEIVTDEIVGSIFPMNPRIWGVQCLDGVPYSLSYEKILILYSNRPVWIIAIAHAFMIFLMLIAFYGERKSIK